MASLPITIQIISLLGAFGFLFMIFRLIVRGRLREEYSIIWILCTLILIVFSIWRRGLEQISLLLGVYYPPSLIFIAAIFAIIVFLVHLSVVNSKLQSQIKTLAQEIAYLKQQITQLTPGEADKAASTAAEAQPIGETQ